MDDPARPDPGSGSLLKLQVPIDEVWAKIAALIDARVSLAVGTLAMSGVTNVAMTMGSPDTPAVASANPWGFVVLPFYAKLLRIEYFQYPTGSFSVDVKIIRPGGTLGDAATVYPGLPPSIVGGITRINPDDAWIADIEPGAVLVFYLTAASGVNLVTANVILRTIG
jgi:hypothetical protein